MEKKICIKCNVEKEINEFQLQKFKKYSRYCSWCKDCNKIYQKEYREKNKNKIKNQRHNFYEENKSMILNRNKKWNENNIEKVKEYNKNYHLEYSHKNREMLKLKMIEYRKNNKDKIKDYCTKNRKRENERTKKRLKNDKLFKLKHEVRTMLYGSFKRKKYTKNDKSEKILGCSIEYFINHLLQTFKNNYGYEWNGIEKVHIDHIIPLKQCNTEEEVIKCCHYTNLQLLKAEDNLRKSCKLQK